MVCLASKFLTVDVTENTQTHNNYLAIVPIPTVLMAVRALGKIWGKLFEYDLYPHNRFYSPCYASYGRGSSVGIETTYGLDGPASNAGGDEIFRPFRPTLGPTQPSVKWVPSLSPAVKCGRGVLLTTNHLLVARSWKSRAIPLPTIWATPGL